MKIFLSGIIITFAMAVLTIKNKEEVLKKSPKLPINTVLTADHDTISVAVPKQDTLVAMRF